MSAFSLERHHVAIARRRFGMGNGVGATMSMLSQHVPVLSPQRNSEPMKRFASEIQVLGPNTAKMETHFSAKSA